MALGYTCGGLIAAAVTFGLLAGATAAQDTRRKVDPVPAYKMHCLICHGPKGDSKLPGMSFADGAWKHGNTVKDLSTTIRNGVPGTAMLPFKSKLKEPEIDALAQYVRAFDPKLK